MPKRPLAERGSQIEPKMSVPPTVTPSGHKIPSWALNIRWDVKVFYQPFTSKWEWSATGQEYNRDTRDSWPELHNVSYTDFETKEKAFQDAHKKLKEVTAAIRAGRVRDESLQDIEFEVIY